MFNVSGNKDFLDFVNDLESRLNKKIDLNSYDREVLNVLYEYNKKIEDGINDELNNKIFENLTGDYLDDFLNFFNIPRLSGNNNDIYSFGFRSVGKDYFTILKNSYILYKGELYKVIYGTSITYSLSHIRCQKSVDSVTFSEPIFSINAEVKFDKKGLTGNCNLEAETPAQLLLVTYEAFSPERESDFEYRERGKSIMQSNGYSNRVKIINEIISNNIIKNVVDEEVDGFVNFTIIPNTMDNMEEALNYSKEVVDYYRNEYMGVSKPNVLEININRVLEHIYGEENEQEIINELTTAISTILYNSVERITKVSILNEISNIFVKYGINDYNINNVLVTYKFYSKNNYLDYIIENEITDSKIINKNTVITFGTLT
ncbi:hypothetical protein [Cetobacterium sp.]|uniref:hypothetical protein n=1 Tax=Cetobacterium sp. TaxID=2071632 RepID=UPI003F2DCA1D